MVQSSDISASFFFRERSFSLIYFAGLTHDAIPELLVRCDYSIIGEAQYNAPFLGVLNAIEVFDGPHKINGVGTFEFLHKQLKWPKPN